MLLHIYSTRSPIEQGPHTAVKKKPPQSVLKTTRNKFDTPFKVFDMRDKCQFWIK